ncbi:MAG: nucleoid-associated protein [Selenomonas sp.]|uniref:nucleoid-associated protein n=1 Tax=Selenomonas sp. TaxID=2053611 RepID=UPI0025EB3428|nr:nucleoid-associated protein [Selenomonas sp.]MCR5757988.1 nucleoid-associated protein [Selenomonas sp.]
MVVIDKAILHILDFNSGMTVYSDEELTVQDSIETFLLKHIEKAWGSQDAKPGTFYEDSHCAQLLAEYLSGEMSFVPFSKELAKKLEDAFVHAEEMASSDVIVADVRIDDRRQIVIFKSNSHIGYTHQVNQTEAGIKNEIINHYSIMPNLSQKMEEFAFIDTETKAVSVTAKKYTIDGNSILVFPEVLLECSLTPSPKEAIKNLSKTAAKVAEAYGQDQIATEAAVKSYVTENMQTTDELDLTEAGREIFKENPSMQADFDTAIKEAGFTEPVKMDQEATIKKMCKHKLKTDTGIELTVPSEYFDNTEFMEFHNNEDGTLSIMLKHIGNIVNRG